MSVGILLLALAVQLLSRSFFANKKLLIWWGSVFIIFLSAGVLAREQYLIWAGNGLTNLLLPPHRSIGYFALYSLHHFFGQWIVSFCAGILGGYAAYRLNQKYDERFFEAEEPWMFAMGIFLSGFPGFLTYVLLIFHTGILFTIAYALLQKGRAPLYWLWLPLAILAILITNWYVPKEVVVMFNL